MSHVKRFDIQQSQASPDDEKCVKYSRKRSPARLTLTKRITSAKPTYRTFTPPALNVLYCIPIRMRIIWPCHRRNMKEKADVWQGTLALMILKTLETMGPQHGYGIARRIEQTSGQHLVLNYGTLYPSLVKL